MSIEHDPVETVEEEPPQAPVDPKRPSAHEVIAGAIAQRLPCQNCGSVDPCACVTPADERLRLHDRATLVEQALVLYGYLPKADEEGGFDAEETARWLASRSGFPRYVDVVDGWKRLLEAEADVELAAIKASRRVPGEELEMVKAAKAALLAYVEAERRKPSPQSG